MLPTGSDTHPGTDGPATPPSLPRGKVVAVAITASFTVAKPLELVFMPIAMLAEWLTGLTGLGGVLNAYKGSGNFSGVWAIVVVSVTTSLVAYAVASVLETAVLAAWGPNAGKR